MRDTCFYVSVALQASIARERALAVPPDTCGASCSDLVASKARHAAQLLQLTLTALRSNAEAQSARKVRTYERPVLRRVP